MKRSPDSERDPAELEEDINRTRESLGRTVDELEHRLSPGELVDQVLGMVREHGGEFAGNLGRSVKSNPVPMLLTGVGLAWMMASSGETRASTGQPRPEGRRESLAAKAKSAGTSVTGGAREARHRISDTVGSAGERVRSGADHARSGFEHLLEEQPLVLGAMGVAFGAALGAAFPRTEREDRLLGDASDSLAGEVRHKASEAYDEVRDRAGEAAEAVQESQQREPPAAGDTPWETTHGTEH